MDDFERHLQESLKDSEFRKAWEEDEALFQARRALIAARIDAEMTQGDLAKATGMDQRAISRIETGNTNATIKTLDRLARGMGKRLRIEFV